MDLAERINTLFLEKGFDFKNGSRHELTRATKAMFGDISESALKSKRKVIEDHVKGKVTSVQYDWIKNYCDFFGCSADYLLGFMEKDISEETKKSGLSEKAIRRLKTNKDYLLVTNTLLVNNGIDYLVQALQAHTYYLHMNNYLAAQLKAEKIFGATQSDLEMFNTNLQAGNQSQKERFAVVCFDKILKDSNLLDHFLNQASDRFSKQLDDDIKKIGSK